MSYEHDIKPSQLCKESINQFQKYLDRSPDDKDVPDIVQAIEMLKKRCDTLKQIEKAQKHMKEPL